MQHQYDPDIRLNAFGAPDIDYYTAEAHKMRSQAVGVGLGAIRAWLSKYLDRIWFPDRARSQPARRGVQSH